MKKILLTIALLGTVFLSFGCTKKNSNLVEISYSEFADKVKNRESFVVYVGSATCSHCSEFKPTLEKVIKENGLTVYYLDRSKFTSAQDSAVKDKVQLQGTPTLCNIVEGNAQNDTNLVGTKDYDSTVEYFEVIGYIE